MFGLKIFVRVQTFRRVPHVLPRNFCHPASHIPILLLSASKVVCRTPFLVWRVNTTWKCFKWLDIRSCQTKLASPQWNLEVWDKEILSETDTTQWNVWAESLLPSALSTKDGAQPCLIRTVDYNWPIWQQSYLIKMDHYVQEMCK